MEKVKVCSIDSSTRKTGMALFLDGELNTYQLIDLSTSKDTADERINIMGRNMLLLLSHWCPEIVYIEEPQGHGQNVKLVNMLCQIIGIVRGWCIENKAYFEVVSPSVWRKYLGMSQGGKKRAELKEESKRVVKDTYDVDVNDDVADAINIGNAMINRYSKEKKE